MGTTTVSAGSQRPGRAPADRRPSRAGVQRQQAWTVAEMVRQARADGEDLTGPQGLLKRLTKLVLETALEEEMTEHLGHGKHRPVGGGVQAPTGGDGGGGVEAVGDDGDGPIRNVRNGTRTKTVLTDSVGKVQVTVPRGRAGTFEPVIVGRHQRKLGSVEAVVLSLTAKGLTTGEISAHLAEIYGAGVSRDTISWITERIGAEMNEWLARPLEQVYAAIFIDAIVVKVRDGAGRQQALLRRDRGHRRGPQGRPRVVGRHLW